MNLSRENNRVLQPFSVRGLIVKQLEDLNDYELLKSVNYLVCQTSENSLLRLKLPDSYSSKNYLFW